MKRKLPQASLLILLLLTGERLAYGQVEMIRPRSIGYFGNTLTLFQAPSPLLLPNRKKKDIYPFYQYLEFSVASPSNNISFNTFLRERIIFNGDEDSFDVYNAFIQYNNNARSFELRLGRQIITDSVNFFLLDGGLIRIRPIDGLQLVAYGGFQGKDLQPEPEQPIESFIAAGIKLVSDKLLGSLISVGYELYDPIDFPARHLLNVSFNRVVPFTDFADIYGLSEIDLGEGNLALLTLGVGITFTRFFYLNLEYDTYNLDEDRNEFQLDPIFDIFSISRLHQAKIGFTLIPTNFLEVQGSYAFSRYEILNDEETNGNIAKLGFSWDFWREIGLRAFNGIYFIDGRKDDYAFGLNLDVTEEIYRGLEFEFSFAYSYYDKITNQEGNAFSYIMGFEYLLIRDLVLRTGLEINTNPDFDKDVRVDLGISYNFSGIK